jgi:microcystin-dependent protein
MGNPYLGEIKIMSYNGPVPNGWALCNGQLLPINQNQALFSLLGTTYGGDGRINFALPNLRGQVPIHMGNGHTLGERGGETAHTLITQEMPAHTHTLSGSSQAVNDILPPGNAPGQSAPNNLYTGPASLVAMNAKSVTSVGGSQPHNNMQPYLVLSFCIALQGIFPSQT